MIVFFGCYCDMVQISPSITFEHNCHKKLLPEVGQNGAFQENQHFYVVSKLEKKI